MPQFALPRLFDQLDVHFDSFALWEVGRMSRVQRCSPDTHNLHLVLQGEGVVIWAGGRREIRPGSLILIPAGVDYTVSGGGVPEQAVGWAGQAEANNGWGNANAFESKAFLVLGCASFSLVGNAGLGVRWTEPLCHDLEHGASNLLLQMFAKLLSPAWGAMAAAEAQVKRGPSVPDLHGETDRPLPPAEAVHPGIERVVANMVQRPQGPYTLASLARMAGMSRTRFCEQFARYKGVSAMEFLRRLRLELAAKLLRTSNASVEEVAAAVGYSSRSHFSKAFSKAYGVDPSRFRHFGSTKADANLVMPRQEKVAPSIPEYSY